MFADMTTIRVNVTFTFDDAKVSADSVKDRVDALLV